MDIGLGRNPEPLASPWSCCGEIGMDLCPWFKRDNAGVNRADEKCKLVKMAPDTMGGTIIRRLANRKV